jgi:sec-independent protein translocase protein TatA
MGLLAPQHLLLIAIIVLLVFGGRGKISSIMGDFAQGIKAFKKGMAEEPAAEAPKSDGPMKTIDHQAAAADLKQPAKSESQV